jgi:hypothetical protein
MAFGVWIAVMMIAFALARKRPCRRDVVVAVPFLLLGLWALRNVTIAPLVGLPIVARLLASARPRPMDRSRLNGIVLTVVLLAGGAWTVRAVSQPDFDLRRYPVEAMRAIDRQGLLGRRLFTSDWWGAYVIHAYWPRQHVFIDDRYDMYPPVLSKDYMAVLNGDPRWGSVLDSNRIDVVVWHKRHVVSRLLTVDPRWRQVYQDDLAVVFVRR